MNIVEKLWATLHRLAESRKFVLAIGTGILVAAPQVLEGLQLLPGWTPTTSATFMSKAQFLSAAFLTLGAWLQKLIKDEDVARANAAAAVLAPPPAAPEVK